jgi:hypothetical protein
MLSKGPLGGMCKGAPRLAAIVSLLAALWSPLALGDGAVRFSRDIRPILSDRCFTCHGPDPSERRAKLRLDEAEHALGEPGSGAAIVPGNLEESELWLRITSTDPHELMPPAKSGKRPLSAQEVALIRAWIEGGAAYEPHWSFTPPLRPPLPQVPPQGRSDGEGDAPGGAWARTPVDRFLMAAMEAKGVSPSPPADRAVLVRRLHLDLTGLPPTPEESAAFIADERPDAYERLVHALLDTEPYRSRHAEHMAVAWLDAARYADTSGIHMDAGRQMWLWRDWVLEAFRRNLTFDRFLTDQLAGDLLMDVASAAEQPSAQPPAAGTAAPCHPPEPELATAPVAPADRTPSGGLDRLIASGFNRNHVTSDEGGAIDEEYLLEYAVDRASTTATVFLGLTMGCARCHDHKYDPISQGEFYSFLAYFNSVEEPGVYSQSPDAKRALEPALRVPTTAQRAEREALERELRSIRAALDVAAPDEDARRAEFMAAVPAGMGLSWRTLEPVAATSEGGASLAIAPDGSILASGLNPARDLYTLVLRTEAQDLRFILLEALADPSLPHGRPGRAENGNAVLTGIEIEAISLADANQRTAVRLTWAWADVEQADGDFAASNVLRSGDEQGWAIDAHQQPGNRALLLCAEEPFGYEGGTELRVRLEHRSRYDGHALGRVRVHAGSLRQPESPGGAAAAPETLPVAPPNAPPHAFPHARPGVKMDAKPSLDALPIVAGTWHVVGPFPPQAGRSPFESAFGPEESPELDRARNFGFGNQYWRADPGLRDDQLNALAVGAGTIYVGRELYVPSSRSRQVSLGSDDGVRVFLNGREVLARDVERVLAPDQDRLTLELRPGVNTVLLRIVNTGGEAGFHWRLEESAAAAQGVLPHDLIAALLPPATGEPTLAARAASAWRSNYLPEHAERRRRSEDLDRALGVIDAAAPQTMVMRERTQPRQTFVMLRGLYDQPDRDRPVSRGVPAALGTLAQSAPHDRRGLAEWMLSVENPLVSRVAVNRIWEQFFGAGIVPTSEDFGLQGEWPSHPELLDWLAVELRDPQTVLDENHLGGAQRPAPWDLRHIIRLIVLSSAYRQSSVVREDLRDIDPENRLLAWFPRRRLTAEQTRDQALYLSGLLVERFGGPSVKPYQPDGLWQEVAMPGSNTRVYAQGSGEDLWRRSLYTYWKRAAPPPSLLTFDAPTRETCTVRRPTTSSPLQALVLWNDVQFVEASRVLAQRCLQTPLPEGAPMDGTRLDLLFSRCVGRLPDPRERSLLEAALEQWRDRYQQAPADAAALLAVGEAPLDADLPAPELAAWTMIASSMLSLHTTNTRE